MNSRYDVVAIIIVLGIAASLAPGVGGVTRTSALTVRQEEGVEFRVWRTFGVDRKGFTVAIVGVDSRYFTDGSMRSLAAELNIYFRHVQKLKVGLYEPNMARRLSEGLGEPDDFVREERGRYLLDREAGTERIEFLVPGAKARRVKIVLNSVPKRGAGVPTKPPN